MKGLKRVFVLLLLLVVPVTFLAGCNKVKFKISFMVDGEVYDTIKTNGNEIISMPENPTKDGYDFDGWYWDEDEWEKPFTANSLLDAPLSSDMKVYARFIVKHTTHTLTHHAFKDSTCTANGYEEYWQCQVCNKLFSDAYGYNQISSPQTIVSQGHKFGNWTETKSATYTEQGEERRDCTNCNHYETRPIPKLVAIVVESTTITIDYGIIKWNGSSPFGFEVIVNGKSYTVNTNQLETTLKFNGYNEVKVASINEDNTKSNYITLNGFVVNNPITNLAYVDDSTNVKFTWESSSNLYDYSFAVNGTEVNIDKATHTYSVKRNTLKKGDVIEVYVKGLASNNVYPSKKVVLLLDQMDSPTLAINKLNVEWNAVNHADKYMVNATSNKTITGTTYSYDGANAGKYTITVTALGNNYLCNSSTLTFTKFAKPTISIKNSIVSWNAIVGQFMYATLKNGSETRFEANSFELTDRTQNYEMLLYAYPALNNTMQSDNILIGNFVYKTYYTAYYRTQVNSTKTYSISENSTTIYVPTGFETKNFSNCNQDLTLIASSGPSKLSNTLIKNIIISDDTTTLSASAFSGCNLESIQVDTENTVYASPNNCNAIIELATNTLIIGCKNTTIPNSVTNIGYSAFSGCSGLTSITIPNSVTSIGSYAFYGCSALTSITLPFVGNGSDKTNFGYIFGASSYVPSSLKSVIITGGTSIGYSAFSGCSSLTSVYISDIESWCNIDFNNGSSNPLCYANSLYLNNELVTDLIIPNSVTSIGDYAFSGCLGLISITIPNSVTSIGYYAFSGCSGLTSITIPNSVTSIGDSAFSGCSALTSITLPFVGNGLDKTNFGYIFGASSYVPSSLKSVTITGGTSIGRSAFNECSGLTSITIPDSVTSIGDYAFWYCSGLTSITIPNSVTSIGDVAFYECSGLTSITIPNSVTSIGYSAFSGCSGLTSITIPNSVTSIRYSAFENCSGLTSIIIPNGVTSIGYSAFSGCNNLVYNKYESANYLGNNANPYLALIKAENTNIESCTIHNDTKILYHKAFSGCSVLTSITIPNSVTSIGDSAFYGCSGLTSITIPNTVTGIGNYAFDRCSGLTSVTFEENSKCESIGDAAFGYCSKLTSITIPNSVTIVGTWAFTDCSSITLVYYEGNESDWNSIEISGCNSDLTNATRYYYSETQPTTTGNYWHYDENGDIVIW